MQIINQNITLCTICQCAHLLPLMLEQHVMHSMHFRTFSFQDWWWNHGCLPFGKLSYQAQGDKNIYQGWSADLLFSQKLDNWKTLCTSIVCRVAQATEVCAASECNLHRMQNPFGAGTALLDILLLSVSHNNALNQGHKLVNSFSVAENAQYVFAKIPHLLT